MIFKSINNYIIILIIFWPINKKKLWWLERAQKAQTNWIALTSHPYIVLCRCGCSTKDFPSQSWDSGGECYEVGVRGPCPKGHVFGSGGMCHTLYTKGYCQSPGEWLVPQGDGGAKCECRTGYGPVAGDSSDPCQPPLVALARFLSNGFKWFEVKCIYACAKWLIEVKFMCNVYWFRLLAFCLISQFYGGH